MAFGWFVILAEMRTGSNFLESNLNQISGVRCLGEAFNPHFIGYPDTEEVLGVTLAARDAEPDALIGAVRQAGGMTGFRYFSDHDPRVFDRIMQDRSCAKIVLTRNPVETYVSLKIARSTGQWKLTRASHQKARQARFEAEEFAAHMEASQAFQLKVSGALQRSGQTAFYVNYEDLQDLEVLNGLAAWLGAEGRLESLSRELKKQNPAPMSDKVVNFAAMRTAIAKLDRFDLSRTPAFEPRRGPGVPNWVVAAEAPLMFQPIVSGPERAVTEWMAALDGVAPGALPQKLNQGAVRDWMQSRPGHRRFTVLRHPAARAHRAFEARILSDGPGSYGKIRQALIRQFGLEVPGEGPVNLDDGAHRRAFLVFLEFLRANLNGQTAIRVDGAWASQLAVVQGMSQFAPPDMVIREDRLAEGLALLVAGIGRDEMPEVPRETDRDAVRLARIYDEEVEAAARAAYGRDYEAFGFHSWSRGTVG